MSNRWATPVTLCGMAVAFVTLSAPAVSAMSDADKCAAKKMKVAGKYVFCRLKQDAKAVKKGGAPDYSKCDSKFAAKWANIESKAGGACPTTGDVAEVANIAIADAGLIAGTVTLAGRFRNNSDGTTSDLHTGLTWENKAYLDDSIHDVSNGYEFDEAFSVHVATLNSTSFAGYSDWRVPTPLELLSLINFDNPGDVKGYPEFDWNCSFVCDEAICPTPAFDALTSNCAFSELSNPRGYWTSTTNPEDPSEAVVVEPESFILELEERKTSEYSVMAVRGGRAQRLMPAAS